MELNEAIKLFRDSEKQIEVMMKKAECARSISNSLAALRVDTERIFTNIQCEVAVMEARKIISE